MSFKVANRKSGVVTVLGRVKYLLTGSRRREPNGYRSYIKPTSTTTTTAVPLRQRPAPARLQRNRCSVCSVAVSLGQHTVRTSDDDRSFSGESVPRTVWKMPEGKQFERLPDAVRPRHYSLLIEPDLKTFVFRGVVSIEIEVGPTNICPVPRCLRYR